MFRGLTILAKDSVCLRHPASKKISIKPALSFNRECVARLSWLGWTARLPLKKPMQQTFTVFRLACC